MLRGKGKKGSKVSTQQESPFREILEHVRENADMGCGPQMMRRGYLAVRVRSWEEFRERYREKEESSEWTLERIREAHEKSSKRWNWTLGNRPWNFEEEHRLREADHCAGPWNGRSHPVVYLPAWQQFSSGGLHLVGIDRTRRQQQQEEEALQLVVRGVWRQIWMESTQQDSGDAARHKWRWGNSFQSARGPTRALWKFHQCAQAAGEPTERWWQSSSKRCCGLASKKWRRYKARFEKLHWFG